MVENGFGEDLNERYAHYCFNEMIRYGGGGVMVWGGISLEARTGLVIMERGRIIALKYMTDSLVDYVPCAPFVGPDFVFMYDNASPHIANVVRDYLDEVDIRRMNWSACTPDRNLIEHVWDKMGIRIRRRENVPETIQGLQRALREEWEQL